MASASKTPNLNLPQWVGTEKLERTDFNAAFDAIDTTVALHLAENASKHITESGSNDDGYYIKFDDGTQECWHTLSIPYLNVNECLECWNYPVQFKTGTEPTKTISHNLETNIARYLITGVRISRQSTEQSHAAALVRALSAGGDFTSDSTVEVGVRAIGRWK